jgi:hypothetical protein
VSDYRTERELRRARRRSRNTVVRVLLVGLLIAFVFLLGVAFAQALDERPERGDSVTDVRTLTPMQQQPPARTVTVTVTSP